MFSQLICIKYVFQNSYGANIFSLTFLFFASLRQTDTCYVAVFIIDLDFFYIPVTSCFK